MKLANQATTPPKGLDKKKIIKKTKKIVKKIEVLQHQMCAQGKHSILIVLQGMDASGKDGVVKNAFKSISPNEISTVSFKKPSKEEFAHDFLWRVHKHAPAKGMVTVFNRSHYEDILVPSVYGYLDEKVINERFELINNFEKQLQHGGTKIIKFFLNVSKEEQYDRLKERVDLEEKHWKHNDGDWETREHREDFEAVYEKIFTKCNQPEWHIIPADTNWYKTYFVAKTVLKVLEEMKIEWPALTTEIVKFPSKK